MSEVLDFLRTFTDYEQVRPQTPDRAFDLGRVTALLERLGNPHQGRLVVHVTGTKGKGSVAMFTDAILRAHGARTFRYLSPHVEQLNERIAIDGVDADDARLLDAIRLVRPAIEATRAARGGDAPTFFEIMTAMGFVIARAAGVEFDVVEVGIGGRLDATNVVDPAVSVITSIGLDHTSILGSTHDAIAAEKAGIIKPGRPVLLGLGPDDAGFEVLRKRAGDLGAPIAFPGNGIDAWVEGYARTASGRPGVAFTGRTDRARIPRTVAPGGGRHQAGNAMLALAAARIVLGRAGRPLDPARASEAIEGTVLPARAEVFGDRPPVLLDGAHTPQGMMALADLAMFLFKGRRCVALGGITHDRRAAHVFKPLLAAATQGVFVAPPTPRARDPGHLAAAWRKLGGEAFVAADPLAGLVRAQELAGPEGAVIVAGSFYLAGAVRPALRNLV